MQHTAAQCWRGQTILSWMHHMIAWFENMRAIENCSVAHAELFRGFLTICLLCKVAPLVGYRLIGNDLVGNMGVSIHVIFFGQPYTLKDSAYRLLGSLAPWPTAT